jgi:NAD-dependent deacetylase sirtuin 4
VLPLLVANTALDRLLDLARGRPLVALTGAGVSTESGIPDYRSPEALERPRKPIHGPDFIRSPTVRQRYWARAYVGWTRFRRAEPGPSHRALASLEASGALSGIVTQNVDRLHQSAGSRNVIELHGALAEVVCLQCGALEDRDALQERLHAMNPTLDARVTTFAPDGDAELRSEFVEEFQLVACLHCGGVLKPRVVFFGENVARPIVDAAYALVESAGLLLVAGTSLAVFSGYRFLVRAADRDMPIAIINRGPVRGEQRATLKIEAATAEVLAALARSLSPPHEENASQNRARPGERQEA